MKIACCVWALEGNELDALRAVRALGFEWIDIQPGHLETLESRLLAQELGLRPSCLGGTFGLAAGVALDHADESARRRAINHVLRALEKAESVGADTVYVVPGRDRSSAALDRFAASLADLTAAATERSLKLALEHFPGTALPSGSETLAFVRDTGLDNLSLLFDSGHIQISCEDPAAVILDAGERLGYVHFDDNDGVGDLHWSLLDGVMTEESLVATLRALHEIDYQGALSLELSPSLPNPERALAESRDALLRALQRLPR